ncbi:hypothetical protein BTH42_32705 [Burkholderia sp. SRS-W-2-2016]|nr:hypothetical protein BTH42_32705 [Burkholderia sp. SRS-W-2-2016]
MPTLLECLRSLRSDLLMRNLAAVCDTDATVEQHISRLSQDEDGYEVRHEPRNYGRSTTIAVGLIGGPAVFRELK